MKSLKKPIIGSTRVSVVALSFSDKPNSLLLIPTGSLPIVPLIEPMEISICMHHQ